MQMVNTKFQLKKLGVLLKESNMNCNAENHYTVLRVQTDKLSVTSNWIANNFGDYNREDPPVPIPNTEVKLSSAHDTWLETAWENRSLPNFYQSSELVSQGFVFVSKEIRKLPKFMVKWDKEPSPCLEHVV